MAATKHNRYKVGYHKHGETQQRIQTIMVEVDVIAEADVRKIAKDLIEDVNKCTCIVDSVIPDNVQIRELWGLGQQTTTPQQTQPPQSTSQRTQQVTLPSVADASSFRQDQLLQLAVTLGIDATKTKGLRFADLRKLVVEELKVTLEKQAATASPAA